MFSAIEKAIQAIKKAKRPITLNLSNTKISDKEKKVLAEAIKKTTQPITLDLSYNDISDIKTEILAEAIKEAKQPITLNLRDTNISDKKTALLAEAIKEAKQHITLNLSNNNISDNGAIYFFNSIESTKNPISLNISHNKKLQFKEAARKAILNTAAKTNQDCDFNLTLNHIGRTDEIIKLSQDDNFLEAKSKISLNVNCKISLSVNYKLKVMSGGEGERYINKIHNTRYPLHIDFSTIIMSDTNFEKLFEIIKEKSNPITLKLHEQNYKKYGKKVLEIIKTAKNITLDLSEFVTTVSMSEYKTINKQIIQLLDSIKESKFPISLSLKFPHHPNGDPRDKVISLSPYDQIFNNLETGKLTSLTVKQQLCDFHKNRIKQIIDESSHSIIFRSIGLTMASNVYVKKLLIDSVSKNTNHFDLSELSITDSQFELVLNAIKNSEKPVNLKISHELYNNNEEAITNAIKEINAKVMAVNFYEIRHYKTIISDKHIEKLINDQKSEDTISLDLSEASLTDLQYVQIKEFINNCKEPVDLVLQQLNEQNQQFVYDIIEEAKNTRNLWFKYTSFIHLPIPFRDNLVASLVSSINKATQSTKLITLKIRDLSFSSSDLKIIYDNYNLSYNTLLETLESNKSNWEENLRKEMYLGPQIKRMRTSYDEKDKDNMELCGEGTGGLRENEIKQGLREINNDANLNIETNVYHLNTVLKINQKNGLYTDVIDTLDENYEFKLTIQSLLGNNSEYHALGIQKDDSTCGDNCLIMLSELRSLFKDKKGVEIGISYVNGIKGNHAVMYIATATKDESILKTIKQLAMSYSNLGGEEIKDEDCYAHKAIGNTSYSSGHYVNLGKLDILATGMLLNEHLGHDVLGGKELQYSLAIVLAITSSALGYQAGAQSFYIPIARAGIFMSKDYMSNNLETRISDVLNQHDAVNHYNPWVMSIAVKTVCNIALSIAR